MRRIATIALTAALALALSAPGANAAEKFTFADVELPDGQTGEIEASVKTHKHKDDSVYCGYFTDDYQDSLGYSFTVVEPAPTEADAVREFCLDAFDERHT